MKRADWFNHTRLLEPIGYVPLTEAEANYWLQIASEATWLQLKPKGLREFRGGSTREVGSAPQKSSFLGDGCKRPASLP